MVSKKLTAAWAFLAFALLAASGITIAFSIIYRMPNLLLNFTIPSMFLTAGLALGVAYGVTFLFSVGGIVQPNHVTIGLSILNWVLLLDGIGTVAVGSLIWFFTLHERVNYEMRFNMASPAVREGIQNQFSCCGYFFSNETTVLNAGFCQDPVFAQNQTGCVTSVTDFADYTLNNIFTTIYGFMSIIILLFLTTLCVINKRLEAERFRKIDAKRGGRGFV